MGVTLTDAVLEAGLDQTWWYKNHLETVYCLEGEGVLEDLGTGKSYKIKPGTWRDDTQRSRRGRDMNITRNGSQPSGRGPSEYFTGDVRLDAPFQRSAPARVSGAVVTFEPGARTAWHTHPLGQTLIVTSGLGRVQRVGEAVQEIAPGDVVWIEPGEKHWHGASPMTAMTHIAIAEMLDGTPVQWMEKVTDEQYGGVRQE